MIGVLSVIGYLAVWSMYVYAGWLKDIGEEGL